MQPHTWQPTGLPCPWDSPGKNTGVGCHFFLQCMNVKSESEFAQSCPTLSNPKDCSLPGSSIHGIFQARVLELGAIAFYHIIYKCNHIIGTFLHQAFIQHNFEVLISSVFLFISEHSMKCKYYNLLISSSIDEHLDSL